MSSRITQILLLTWLLAGCRDSTSIDEEATFISEPIAMTAGMEEEAIIGSYIGSIQVDGIFIMPSPCHTLDGKLARLGGQLTVTITATSTGGTCPGVLQAVDYRMQRFGMARGIYRVTVYHQQAGGAQRRLINEAEVTVN